MGILHKFESKMEDSLEGAANRISNSPLDPVKIAKKAEKQMVRQKMVGAGKQYAPTLYTVLVNADDDARLFGYYPTLAGETETYLTAKAHEKGLVMDGQPLVRFIADGSLKTGKFDVIAEPVAAPIVQQLRMEEMQRYGIAAPGGGGGIGAGVGAGANASALQASRNRRAARQDAYDTEYAGGAMGDDFDRSRNYNHDYNHDYNRNRYADEPDAYGAYDAYGAGGAAGAADGGLDANRQAEAQRWNRNAASRNAANAAAIPSPAAADVAAGAAVGAAMGVAAGAAIAAGVPSPADPYAGPALVRPDAQTMMMGAQGVQAGGYGAVQQAVPSARLTNPTTGEVYFTHSNRAVIGRGTACDIILDDLNSSRNHAELRYEPQGFWTIADLNSTNGTFVNGRLVTAVPLHEGDTICVGMTNLVFSMRG